jgi:hypothetical protein
MFASTLEQSFCHFQTLQTDYNFPASLLILIDRVISLPIFLYYLERLCSLVLHGHLALSHALFSLANLNLASIFC